MRRKLTALVVAGCSAVVLSCRPAEEPAAEPIRPVRVVTVGEQAKGETISLTGHIHAEEEVNLSFRTGGRVIARSVNVGDRVRAGQVVARLEEEPARNALISAQANLVSARGLLTRAQNDYERQRSLLDRGFTTFVRYDQALQERLAAQAQVDAAQAQLNKARDDLGFTQMISDQAGAVTAVGAEPGEVVQAGQMVVQVAHQGGRDAVFEVPERVIRIAPPDALVTVALASDPAVQTTGKVREVSPQANPVTRTFRVRVGLSDVPTAMRLGSTVVGTVQLAEAAGTQVPASALTRADRQPAVWVVDPVTTTVSLSPIAVERYDLARVIVGSGLQPGDVVVVAGVQTLRPGQKVRLLGATS